MGSLQTCARSRFRRRRNRNRKPTETGKPPGLVTVSLTAGPIQTVNQSLGHTTSVTGPLRCSTRPVSMFIPLSTSSGMLTSRPPWKFTPISEKTTKRKTSVNSPGQWPSSNDAEKIKRGEPRRSPLHFLTTDLTTLYVILRHFLAVFGTPAALWFST